MAISSLGPPKYGNSFSGSVGVWVSSDATSSSNPTQLDTFSQTHLVSARVLATETLNVRRWWYRLTWWGSRYVSWLSVWGVRWIIFSQIRITILQPKRSNVRWRHPKGPLLKTIKGPPQSRWRAATSAPTHYYYSNITTMVLKLHGLTVSTCTQRVATVLIEKKVPFELVNIDMSKGEHKSEAFTKMQPFGQVPVLEVRVCHSTDVPPVLTSISRTMVSSSTKVVPSVVTSPSNMPTRALNSTPRISRRGPSSSRPPPSRAPTGIPMHPELLGRRSSSSTYPYHIPLAQATDFTLQMARFGSRWCAGQEAPHCPRRQARCLRQDFEQAKVYCRRRVLARWHLPPSLWCQALPGWLWRYDW